MSCIKYRYWPTHLRLDVRHWPGSTNELHFFYHFTDGNLRTFTAKNLFCANVQVCDCRIAATPMMIFSLMEKSLTQAHIYATTKIWFLKRTSIETLFNHLQSNATTRTCATCAYCIHVPIIWCVFRWMNWMERLRCALKSSNIGEK